MSTDLSVNLAGLDFPSPIVVASGPLSLSPRHMLKALRCGAGGVVTKTITYDETQQVQPKPRMYVVNKKAALAGGYYSLYSIDLMSEYKPEAWVDLLKQTREGMRREGLRGVLIASIAGRSYDEWEKLAKMVGEAGADAIELNLSCPHIEKGKLMGKAAARDPKIMSDLVKTVKNVSSIPVISKLTPQGANPVDLAEVVVSAGADAIVSTARFQGLVMDTNEMRPILWGGYGGYGGPWQLPISLAWTAHIASRKLGVPIMGSGGLSSGEDIVAFILVGADAVQTCTSPMIMGYEVIPRMIDQLNEWMRSKGFARIVEFKGLALDKIVPLEELPRERIYRVLVHDDRCTGCSACIRVCPYDALSLGQSKKVSVDEEKCDDCGLCISICPFDAMELVEGK